MDLSFWNAPAPIVMGDDEELGMWLEGRDEFLNHVVFKTSGSSGIEKWIALSRDALEWSARTVIEFLGIANQDVLGLALPTSHVGGFGLEARAFFSGARLARFEGGWNPEEFVDWVKEEKVTVSSLVPAQVNDLVRSKLRGPRFLRVIVAGGGNLDEDLKEEARELGWPVQPSYGMTETSSQIATGDGLPLMPGWEAKIEGGRLALKGGGLLSRVIRRTKDGFESLDPKKGGWFVTNDLAEVDEGRLTILGRADRRVKILGELVNLEMLESRWKDLLEVEVVLMTKVDERRGSSLWLVIEGESRDIESLNRKLPGLERLSGWGSVERFPRGALGKIDRAKMTKIHVEYDCAGDESGFI